MNRAPLLNSTIGEYRVTDFLGAGGMGEVYRAVHLKVGHAVAIKVLAQAARDASFGQRFMQEARIQSRLHHPNIATFHDFIECQGRPCIVMEYVDGQTVADRLRSSGPLSVAEALSVFQSVVAAVAHIHGHDVIHRDIKSNNIKLSSAGRVKLLDFGIARSAATPKLTMTGFVVGALESVSPEQLNGAAADERSDIWALGVLLYEMVTGRVPFEARSVSEICDKTSKGTYAPPSTLNPAVPRGVEFIISRCLRKNPAERYQSASVLLEETRRVAAALSCPKPPGPRAAVRWGELLAAANGHRKRLQAVVALALVVATLVYFQIPPTPGGPPRTVVIETTEGPAEAYCDDKYVGMTPISFEARVGQRIQLLLRREGYKDKATALQVGENRNNYDYTLEKIDLATR